MEPAENKQPRRLLGVMYGAQIAVWIFAVLAFLAISAEAIAAGQWWGWLFLIVVLWPVLRLVQVIRKGPPRRGRNTGGSVHR